MPDLQAIIQRHPEFLKVQAYREQGEFLETKRDLGGVIRCSYVRGAVGERAAYADAALLELGTALEEVEAMLRLIVSEYLDGTEPTWYTSREKKTDPWPAVDEVLADLAAMTKERDNLQRRWDDLYLWVQQVGRLGHVIEKMDKLFLARYQPAEEEEP